MLQVDVDSILSALKGKPFGKIAGIYNILLFKHSVNNTNLQLERLNFGRHAKELKLNENLVEKVGPSTAPANSRNPALGLHIRQLVEKSEKSTINNKVKNKPTSNRTTPRYYYKNTINECNKLPEENNGRQNEKSAINQNVDYRSIKSPSLRRKAYSATITTKSKSQPVAGNEKSGIVFHKNSNAAEEINDKRTIIIRRTDESTAVRVKVPIETLTARYAEKTAVASLPQRF